MPDPGEPPPEPMPVDQTGETIIFVADGDDIEAHIQIEYDADSGAERFAWLIPLPQVPEFGISSQELFTRMQEATVPTFGFSSSTDTCSAPDSTGGGGSGGGWGTGGSGGSGGSFDPDDADDCSPSFSTSTSGGGDTTASGSSGWGGETGGDGSSTGGDGSYGGEDDGGMSGEPEVVNHGLVGAFEIFVLEGGTVDGVMTWLETNEFEPDPDAEPIIEDYLNQGHVFVAMKLAPGTESSAVHPIKLRFPGDEFCVPIKMTAIAAQDDMAIRVLVLGDKRAAPANWPHVVRNPLAYNWLQLAPEYEDVTILSIDDDPVDGRGWVTEYAGSSGIVDTSGILNPLWDADAFLEVSPANFLQTLQAQELFGECVDGVCEALHPLATSMLDDFMPVPDGVDPQDFYACPSCFAAFVDLEAFDPPAIAQTVQERIIDPAQRAQDLISDNPYLTRLYTRISPHEMLEDPTFHMNGDLPNVPLPTLARREGHCDFTYDITVEGTFVELNNPDFWPNFIDMPMTQRVEMIPVVGAPQVILDNSEAITASLTAWNDNIAGDVTQPPGEGEVLAAKLGRGSQCSGCGCVAGEPGGGGVAALGLLMLMGLRRRRG